MSRPAKRAKAELRAAAHDDAHSASSAASSRHSRISAPAIPSLAQYDDGGDSAMDDAPTQEDDPLASIAAFLAPTPAPRARQPPQTTFEREHHGAVEHEPPPAPAAAAKGGGRKPAAARKSKAAAPKAAAAAVDSKPLKRSRSSDDVDGDEDDSAAPAAAAAIAPDTPVAEVSKTSKKKGKVVVTTQELGYMAQHGFIASSLPLLSALTRERIMQHDLPAAAQCLRALYPAYRLDVDTVFKTSVEVLERHLRDAGGHRDSAQQLTRFYRKIMNLQPKNLIQVVFELCFLFLSQGQLQEAFDHLSSWTTTPAFTHNDSALQLVHSYMAVIAWEVAKQAKAESAVWTERLRRRQDGDDTDDDKSQLAALAQSLSQTRAQSSADLMLEVRTSSQKALSFEKIARSKLRAAIASDPACSTWIYYYLEAMHDFYRNALKDDDDGAGLRSGGLAATMSASKSRAAENRSKLALLQKRLVRKIDEHIAVTLHSPTGFHLKLHYLSLFRSADPNQPLALPERQEWWLCVRHLAQRDPVSNIAAVHAWQMWREQGCTERIDDDAESQHAAEAAPAAAAAAAASSSPWCIRTSELIDLFAARLDFDPTESWSWLALARLLAATLSIDDAALQPWIEDEPTVDDIASVAEGGVKGAVSVAASPPRKGPADPTLSDSERSHSNLSSPSSAARRRKRLQFPVPPAPAAADTSASASSTPVLAPLPSPFAQRTSSASSSQAGGSSDSLPSRSSSMLSAGSGDLDVRGMSAHSAPAKIFPHNTPASMPVRTEAQRRSDWSGRIEWWVQAAGWWRDVRQIDPTRMQTAQVHMNDAAERLSALRGVCLWMTLRSMGWIPAGQ